jgi:hypothetical protein
MDVTEKGAENVEGVVFRLEIRVLPIPYREYALAEPTGKRPIPKKDCTYSTTGPSHLITVSEENNIDRVSTAVDGAN